MNEKGNSESQFGNSQLTESLAVEDPIPSALVCVPFGHGEEATA
jgi:hypothetical protein